MIVSPANGPASDDGALAMSTRLLRSLVILSALALAGALAGCGREAADRSRNARALPDRAALAAALDSMVATERAFSAYAQTAGLKDAFLRHLASDAIVFEPLPVPAAGKVEQWPAPSAADWAVLWEPSYAEISAAGDLGWDTGPADLRPPAAAQRKPIQGQFNSVWRRDEGGPWKLVCDLGVEVSPPAAIYGEAEYEAGPLPDGAADATLDATADTALPDLAALDRALGEATANGIAAGVASRVDERGRLHHQGLPASVGPEAVRTALDSLTGAWRLVPAGSGVARSNDLGYSYGVLERFGAGADAGTPPDSSVYLNVWKRKGANEWRLALAVVKPLR
jgi:ketosteroid isomerase-like protein